MGMPKVVKKPTDGLYYWYPACLPPGKPSPDSGYKEKKGAEIALRLHENGCKDC